MITAIMSLFAYIACCIFVKHLIDKQEYGSAVSLLAFSLLFLIVVVCEMYLEMKEEKKKEKREKDG